MKFHDQVLNWLLQNDNPPVRYLTLVRLLKQPEASAEVQQAKAALMDYPVTRAILQHSDEFWPDDERAYWKYTGKYWQVIFLGQFLADGSDPRIARGVQDLLQQRKWVTASGGQCLTANMLAALRRLGYADHPVVREETESLASRIVADRGLKCSVMEYSLLPRCYMALPKQLLLFAEIPPQHRSPAVKAAIELMVQILLENEIYLYVPASKKDWQKILENAPRREQLPAGQTVKAWIAQQKNDFLQAHGLGARMAKAGWLNFGFPLHYNSDILEALYALALLATPMAANLQKPLAIVRDKMLPDGTWLLENSLNGKMWADVEEKGKPSKWITFFALYILDHFQMET